jgi:hypothetical protein
VPADDRAHDSAWQVQELLTQRGQHRSAGPVGLVVAATAELRGLPSCTATGTSTASPPSRARRSSGTGRNPVHEGRGAGVRAGARTAGSAPRPRGAPPTTPPPPSFRRATPRTVRAAAAESRAPSRSRRR